MHRPQSCFKASSGLLLRYRMHTDAYEAGRGLKCCDYWIMEGQEDFIKEKSLLEIEITARGHKCIFYPKFYCELNYTEFFWGAVECHTRLDSVSLTTIRRFADRSRRWMEANVDCPDDRQQAFTEG